MWQSIPMLFSNAKDFYLGIGECIHLFTFKEIGNSPRFICDAHTPKLQNTLNASWDPKKKEEVDTMVARFFFHDNISFNVAR